jgi:two-component system, OmpR family, response regulator CpxR
MPVITMFRGTFCEGDSVVQSVLKDTGYKLVLDQDIVTEASRASSLGDAKVNRAFSARTSVFNKFTHERERSIAHLRLALAEWLSRDDLLIDGFVSLLVPREVGHSLRVCLIADMKFRLAQAVKEQGLSEKDAVKVIRKQDEDRVTWVYNLFQKNSPWDPSLYDIVIPMNKKTVQEAAGLIVQNAASDAVKMTEVSGQAVKDFLLAARVEVVLAGEGHHVGVSSKRGLVTLVINKHVLMLGRLEEELKAIAGRVEGVQSVETRVGSGFYQADVYRKFDFELPSKVLLVDDEREFVQTLSERLLMREMGSVVAYDGESALSMVNEDEPEVMILDLKMPGIDGIEVLRRVKETRPEIEVIILTGHGSEADRETCMKLGAFAYLQKPADIEMLSDTLKRANEKVQHAKDLRKRKELSAQTIGPQE